MKKILFTIGILVAVVAGWLIISRTGDHQNMSPADRTATERVPDFALQNYDGKTVRLADFIGKPLVINSWAAWCPFCRKELIDFAAVQEEFSAEGGSASGGGEVTIIAINRAESLEIAEKYTDELGVTENMLFLLDPSDSFYQSIGGFSMPETIFVNKDGDITTHKRGPMDINEIREKIKEIL